MDTTNTSIAIHQSKNSDKVIKFITESELTNYCSKEYANNILAAKENGSLWGCYFTLSGKVKAQFI